MEVINTFKTGNGIIGTGCEILKLLLFIISLSNINYYLIIAPSSQHLIASWHLFFLHKPIHETWD